MSDHNLFTEILVIVLLIFASVLHGITGMGFPMISTMSVALIFPLPVAVALVVLPNVIINIMVLMPSKHNPRDGGLVCYIKKYWQLIVSSVLGSIIGVLLLKALPTAWLYLLLSASTLFYVFYTLLKQKKGSVEKKLQPIRHNRLKMVVFGLLAGMIGGATNAMSSILMMYLLAVSDNKNEIVKTSNLCFLLAKVIQIMLLKDELLGLEAKALWAIPIVTLFGAVMLLVGIKIRDKISIKGFKQIILLILVVLAFKAGWNALQLLG